MSNFLDGANALITFLTITLPLAAGVAATSFLGSVAYWLVERRAARAGLLAPFTCARASPIAPRAKPITRSRPSGAMHLVD